jgi:putative endonuclease
MYYVYILRSLPEPKQTYIGYSQDINERLNDHNAGNSIHTNKFKPWEIIWYCAFRDEKKAKNFELYLKTASGIAFRNKRLI